MEACFKTTWAQRGKILKSNKIFFGFELILKKILKKK